MAVASEADRLARLLHQRTSDGAPGEIRPETAFGGAHRGHVRRAGDYHDTAQLSRYVHRPTLLEDPLQGFGVGTIRVSYATAHALAMIDHAVMPTLALHGELGVFHHQIFDTHAMPKLAAVWTPTPDDTVKLVVARGLRSPTIAEAYFNDVTLYLPNPGLRSETATYAEAVYERHFAELLTARGSVFFNHYDHLIRYVAVAREGEVFDPENPAVQAQNAGSLQTVGGELALEAALPSHTVLRAGAALQQARSSDPEFLAGFANLTANLALTQRVARHITTTAVATLVGERPGHGTRAAPAIPAYLRIDANVRAAVAAITGLSFELRVENLTDARLYHPVGEDFLPITAVREPGRRFHFGVEYAF